MGCSVSGHIGFGVKFEYDDDSPPWVQMFADTDDSDISWSEYFEHWWLVVNGWDLSKKPTDPYHEARQAYSDYYDAERRFGEKHPCPLKVDYSGHYEWPTLYLLDPLTVWGSHRHESGSVLPISSVIADRYVILDFCKQYGIDLGEQKPQWHLYGSYG